MTEVLTHHGTLRSQLTSFARWLGGHGPVNYDSPPQLPVFFEHPAGVLKVISGSSSGV